MVFRSKFITVKLQLKYQSAFISSVPITTISTLCPVPYREAVGTIFKVFDSNLFKTPVLLLPARSVYTDYYTLLVGTLKG